MVVVKKKLILEALGFTVREGGTERHEGSMLQCLVCRRDGQSQQELNLQPVPRGDSIIHRTLMASCRQGLCFLQYSMTFSAFRAAWRIPDPSGFTQKLLIALPNFNVK